MSDSSDDDIGYRKPPQHTRFKPGQSGNRAGRPRGSRTQSKSFKSLLYEMVTVKTSARRERLPRFAVMFEVALRKALEGDVTAKRNVEILREKCGLVTVDPEPVRHGVLALSSDPAVRRQQLREAGISGSGSVESAEPTDEREA